jgi:hypothetical protein
LGLRGVLYEDRKGGDFLEIGKVVTLAAPPTLGIVIQHIKVLMVFGVEVSET